MIKKKLSILLSLSLAVLFISLLGTTSLAFVPTENELKNFICNYALFYNEDFDINSLMTYLDEHSSDLQSWLTYLERYEGRYILSGANGRVFMWVYTGSESNLNTYGPYRNGVNVYVNTSYLTRFRWDFILNSNYEFTSWGSYDTTIANSSNQYFYYTDTNIYTNSTIANGSIWANSGTSNPNRNLFSGPYNDDYFTFLLNSNLNTITINGDSVPYIEHNTNQATTYVLGQLGLAENFYNAELFTYRWQQGSWKLQNIRTLENIGPTTDNLIEVTIRGDWINPNTVYSLQMNPDPDSDFAPYSQPFFVKNRYTSITNGALDLDNTFSGDYYNNYNNDTNTDKIINNDKSLYDKMFTVSGEQMQQILDNTMAQINIPSGELEEIDMIFNYLNREPGDFVISWGNYSPNLTIKGIAIASGDRPFISANAINFSELERNNQTLATVMYWERLIVNVGIFSIIIHEAYIILLTALGVPVAIYGRKLEEKETLHKQQQENEQKWLNRYEEQRYNDWLRGHRK